jgi:hypothetical protein
MPYTVTLEKGGMTVLVDESMPIEKIVRSMERKGATVILRSVSGKRLAVRGSDIVLVREITQAEVEENTKRAEEMREKERRFTPAPGPKLVVPHRHPALG